MIELRAEKVARIVEDISLLLLGVPQGFLLLVEDRRALTVSVVDAHNTMPPTALKKSVSLSQFHLSLLKVLEVSKLVTDGKDLSTLLLGRLEACGLQTNLRVKTLLSVLEATKLRVTRCLVT